MKAPQLNKRLSVNGKTYYTKTERRWGQVWNVVRRIAQITPDRITPGMATPALTREQARCAMRQMTKRGELVLARKGCRDWEPVYRLRSDDRRA